MHDDFDDLFNGRTRKAKISEADILETKEIALDRISRAECMFLTTQEKDAIGMQVVWLAPIKMTDAFKLLEGVDALRAAIWQQYVDMLEKEGEL